SMTLGSSSSAIWSGSVSIAMAVGGIVDGPALWDLSVDGKLKFVISSAFGEAYVTSATIIAYAGAPGVPDGGYTLTLLGLAFLGILGAHRRFALAHS
ncbi:MAG: VPDSG-CTERM sorting domain-containing protein, partial [Terrimicrobiaceae bacterium]